MCIVLGQVGAEILVVVVVGAVSFVLAVSSIGTIASVSTTTSSVAWLSCCTSHNYIGVCLLGEQLYVPDSSNDPQN